MLRIIAVSAAVMLASAASAQRTPKPSQPGPAPIPRASFIAEMDGQFRKMDADKNGQLSRSELPKEHKFAAHFDMLDTDKNGTLSAAEFAKGHGM